MADEATRTALATALSMAEIAVADMIGAGLTPQQIAIGLAWQVNDLTERAMPTPEAAMEFKLSLIGASDGARAAVKERADD